MKWPRIKVFITGLWPANRYICHGDGDFIYGHGDTPERAYDNYMRNRAVRAALLYKVR